MAMASNPANADVAAVPAPAAAAAEDASDYGLFDIEETEVEQKQQLSTSLSPLLGASVAPPTATATATATASASAPASAPAPASASASSSNQLLDLSGDDGAPSSPQLTLPSPSPLAAAGGGSSSSSNDNFYSVRSNSNLYSTPSAGQRQQQQHEQQLQLEHRTSSSSNLLLMKRVGSCFFSVSGSVQSDLDLLDWSAHINGAASAAAGASAATNAANNSASTAHQFAQSFISASPSMTEEEDDAEGTDGFKESSATANGTAAVGPTAKEEGGDAAADETAAAAAAGPSRCSVVPCAGVEWNVVDVLYHDIMMSVFSYLPAPDLASFSTAARRPNFDVFFYLQLQLERALLLGPTAASVAAAAETVEEGGGEGEGQEPEEGTAAARRGRSSVETTTVDYGRSRSSSTCPIRVAGAGILSRLAAIDRIAAERLVAEYREGGGNDRDVHDSSRDGNGSNNHQALVVALQHKLSNATMKEKGAASCAVMFTMLGAANKMMGAAAGSGVGGSSLDDLGSALSAQLQHCASGGLGAPVTLIGCAGLGLVASRMHYNVGGGHGGTNDDGDDGEGGGGGASSAAIRMARRMQNLLMTLPRPEEGPTSIFPRQIVEGMRGRGQQFQLGGGDDNDGNGSGEELQEDGSSDDATGGSGDNFGVKSKSKRRRDKRSKRKGSADSTEDVLGNLQGVDNDEKREGQEGKEEEGAGSSSSPRHLGQVAPFSADPYEHLEDEQGYEEGEYYVYSAGGAYASDEEGGSLSSDDDDDRSSRSPPRRRRHPRRKRRKRPTGCIGAYARILRRATEAVADHVRRQRREAFGRLTEDERTQLTTAFIDACSSDSTLPVVKDLTRHSGVDVDGFYVGSDGTTETCALHTAAFNGATEVVRFLCSGIDERDSGEDGGLCDVDRVDDNGWTALHFAAGADSVDGIRTLASHGASMTVEAGNGYTPYHWAERLSNEAAAEELRRLGADDRFLEFRMMFGGQGQRPQPLSFLANRFFALIPAAIPTNG